MENVRVKFNNGKIVLTKDVWYVPGMNNNLMSLGQLNKKGFSVNMKGNLLKCMTVIKSWLGSMN